MNILQYRKFFVYALTFMAYAWSGYGAGLLQNFRDAVLAAETVFSDLFENAITVAHKIKDIHEVFDAAVEEHCIFKCLSEKTIHSMEEIKEQCLINEDTALLYVKSNVEIVGENRENVEHNQSHADNNYGVTPKPDWNHKPESNGCGSLGIEISQEYLPLEEMTKCCNAHDICYDTCKSDKEKCDLEFKRCLYKYCEGYQKTGITIVNTCKGAAKLLFTGTTALGCKSFLDAQKQACYCGDGKSRKPKKAAQSGGDL